MKSLVSIRGVILDALEDMGIDITNDVPTFTRWAIQADREIGSYYSYRRKHEVLTIQGCKAKLPFDAMKVQIVVIGDNKDMCGDIASRIPLIGNNVGLTQTDTFLIVDSNVGLVDNVQTAGIRWDIQDDYLVFPNNFSDKKVTIQYLGLDSDEQGFPKVIETHKEAVAMYIMYKYAIRSRFARPDKRMTSDDIQHFFREWNRLASHARAEDNELSDTDRFEINTMLHDPLSGWGLELGMYRSRNYYGY